MASFNGVFQVSTEKNRASTYRTCNVRIIKYGFPSRHNSRLHIAVNVTRDKQKVTEYFKLLMLWRAYITIWSRDMTNRFAPGMSI